MPPTHSHLTGSIKYSVLLQTHPIGPDFYDKVCIQIHGLLSTYHLPQSFVFSYLTKRVPFLLLTESRHEEMGGLEGLDFMCSLFVLQKGVH